jgi:NADH-quinone oxidoreductase subunit E
MMSAPLLLLVLAIALIAGYLLGRAFARGGQRRDGGNATAAGPSALAGASAATAGVGAVAPALETASTAAAPGTAAAATPTPGAAPIPAPGAAAAHAAVDAERAGVDAERARLLRGLEAESAALRRALVTRDAAIGRLAELDADRRRSYDDLARARAETARYRQLVVDLENNAPPPLLDGPGSPDDLKLIVGVGPVLERMLQQLGIATYRQIARWTERDIDEFDARLHEFPGRIRRDAWVTQARALHQSKFGESLPSRERH